MSNSTPQETAQESANRAMENERRYWLSMYDQKPQTPWTKITGMFTKKESKKSGRQ